MSRLLVEHDFVTALPANEALKRAAGLLTPHGFIRDGEQEMDAPGPTGR